MLTHRQIERKYIELQEAIRENGGVECAQVPDIFFPDDQDPESRRYMIEVAKTICEDCPLRIQCLDYAVSAGMQGIWGGTTDSERKRH
jgi:WhiB family redox-sensing transcriptional regulator